MDNDEEFRASEGDKPFDTWDGHQICSDILQKCQNLLDEIEQLQTYISNNKRYAPIELRRFQGTVKAEMQFVKKVYSFYTFAGSVLQPSAEIIAGYTSKESMCLLVFKDSHDIQDFC